MCVWKVEEKDRRCEYCTYNGGCERYPEGGGRRDFREVAEFYVTTMSDIVGRDIRLRSRKQLVVWARNMVAYQLRQEGYVTTDIGKTLGLDHSTITHCQGKVRDMLANPRLYVSEMRVWREFKERTIFVKT